MGWSEVAARSHARRLEREGWLERHPMTRGQGSLFVATRTGVRVAGVPVRAASAPAPTWWAHLSGCAWAAAWLTARGRGLVGSREVLSDPSWSGEISWHDRKGFHRAGHRPDLVATYNGGAVPIEVELAQKSVARLRAILRLHAAWWVARKSGGVVYICGDEDGVARLRKLAPLVGLHADGGGGLRIELLETIKAEALAAFCSRASERLGRPTTASCCHGLSRGPASMPVPSASMPTGDDLAQARFIPLKHQRDYARFSAAGRQSRTVSGRLIPTHRER